MPDADAGLHKLDGVPAVTVPPTKPARPVAQGLLDLSYAEVELNAAQAEENIARRRLADAQRRVTLASQQMHVAQREYDLSLQQERRRQIDPVRGVQVAG